jgi:hypothetical protein
MFTYDSFAFIQVTFMFFVLMAVGSSVLALPQEGEAPVAQRAGHRPRLPRTSPGLART